MERVKGNRDKGIEKRERGLGIRSQSDEYVEGWYGSNLRDVFLSRGMTDTVLGEMYDAIVVGM